LFQDVPGTSKVQEAAEVRRHKRRQREHQRPLMAAGAESKGKECSKTESGRIAGAEIFGKIAKFY